MDDDNFYTPGNVVIDFIARTLPLLSGFISRFGAHCCSGRQEQRHGGKVDVPDWIDAQAHIKQIGSQKDTAQVNPYKLSNALIAEARKHGAQLVIGVVEEICLSKGKAGGAPSKVSGVKVNGQILKCDVAVVAMGPWSFLAAAWLPLPEVIGRKAHSIVM